MTHDPQLITERIAAALAKADRFDLLSEKQREIIVATACPDVPEDLRREALEFVADAWFTSAREKALGFLATWQPDGRPN